MGNVVDIRASSGSRKSEFVAGLKRENEQLRERVEVLEYEVAALRSERIIEQAKGAMSVRFAMTPEESFELLRGLAESQRRELGEFARAVVRGGGRLDCGFA
jgi:AmiR/NasT family two-component response regulator